MTEETKLDDKFTKEVHVKETHTKEVEKPTEKASISYHEVDLKGLNKGRIFAVEVKDDTSQKCLETFRELKKILPVKEKATT